MMDGDKVLAVVPARMGSKRLKNKNLLNLGGKPLISWSIEAAINSKYIDQVVVSSDDEKVLAISKKFNVQTINRPKALAADTSDMFSVVQHVLPKCTGTYKYIVLCQPTSPLRNSNDIDDAFKTLIAKKADAVISVSETTKNPMWSAQISKNLDMSNFVKKIKHSKRSQDLPQFFSPNGAIYICKIDSLLLSKTFYIGKNIYAHIMPKHRSIDIDDQFDFLFAESLINHQKILNSEL